MRVPDPLLIPALGFLAGLLLSRGLDFRPDEIQRGLCVFAAAALFSGHRRWYLPGLLFFFGALAELGRRPGAPPELDAEAGEIVLLTGCVVEPPALSENREQFLVELEPGARVRVSKYLAEGEPAPALSYGQRIEVEARVRRPRNFGNPGAFDYEGYLARRDIYWTASMPARAQPKLLPGTCGSAVSAWIYGLRVWVLERIERMYAGDAYAVGVLQALTVGESSRLERVWAENYRRTGTYHAIVISGLHITVIAGALILLFRAMTISGGTARLLAVLICWLYAGVCGWQGPVVRAAGGLTLYAFGRFYFRDCRLLNLLAALALLFLAVDPEQVWEASFQLSFLSVLALGAIAYPGVEARIGPLRRGMRGLGDDARDMHVSPRVAQFRIEARLVAETVHLLTRLPQKACTGLTRILSWLSFWVAETFLVSAAIQLGLALPMILYFHRIAISGLLANVIVTPLLTLAVPTGFTALLTGSQWLASLTRWLVEAARIAVEWHAGWDPDWRIADPPFWLALLFLLALIALAGWRKKTALAAAVGLLALIVWGPFVPPREAGTLELTMIDVGQGESLLVGFPEGQWMVVDGGGLPVFGNRRAKPRLEIGEDVVSPYLFRRAIRRLDVLVSTHQHEDHSGGLLALMRNFRPRELWAGATPDSESWRRLASEAARLGVKVRSLRRGVNLGYGGADVEVLAPDGDYAPRASPTNDDSLVLRIVHGKHSFLLTGDVEQRMERRLLQDAPRTEVLKVAHHGSKTSTSDAFLESVRPAFALVSAGKDNIFRHPHPDVTGRLHRRGVMTLRTDELGLVSIFSDGKKFRISAWRWEPAGFILPDAF